MQVGDYVRTIYGIEKIQRIIPNDYDKKNDYVELEDFVFNGFEMQGFFTADEVKSSPNIIDLIEVGDYVNGSQVVRIEEYNEEVYVYVQETEYCNACNEEENIYYKEDTIKSIVTKEQFESVEYKVGVDKE